MQWIRRSGIQLAYPLEDKRLDKWGAPYIVQPKLDGDRCRTLIDDYGNVTLLSSEENEILGAPHITQQLEELGLKNIELDGELYIPGIPHSELHGMVSSQRIELHPCFDEIELHIFDIINKDPQTHRLLSLENLHNEKLVSCPNVHRVNYYVCDEKEEVYDYIDRFVKEGNEGIIVRHPFGLYKRSRSTEMMKFKPGREDIYQILYINEAISLSGEPKGMVGSFTCYSSTIKGTFPVSAGRLTHDERRKLWEVQEILIGTSIKVGYQHLTAKNGVPRHGVALEVLWGV